jgi:hypothetical protein
MDKQAIEPTTTSGMAVGSITQLTGPGVGSGFNEPPPMATFHELPYTFAEFEEEAQDAGQIDIEVALLNLGSASLDTKRQAIARHLGVNLRFLNTMCKRAGLTLEDVAKAAVIEAGGAVAPALQ